VVQGEQDTPAPLRADARRNREQIIRAARALFVSVGPDVPMEEIARAAGVGIGTLYRRFPDRDELIKAVSLDNLARLVEVARQIERDEPDPAVALSTLLQSTLEMRLGIITTVSARGYRAIQDSPVIAAQREEVLALAGRLLRRAQESGTIRPDVKIGDVVLAFLTVSRLAPLGEDDLTEMLFRRVYALLMDGLRTGSGSHLPGRPMDRADIAELRERGGLAAFGKLDTPSGNSEQAR
jgi:AcrR family transcriptional regulator